MPSTVAAGFAGLRTNLEITDLQAKTVSTRQNSVRDAVGAELSVLDSFLVGSYGKDTMIGPLKDADIDIFVVLSADYFKQYRPAALLDKLRTVLLERNRSGRGWLSRGQAWSSCPLGIDDGFRLFRTLPRPGHDRAGTERDQFGSDGADAARAAERVGESLGKTRLKVSPEGIEPSTNRLRVRI